MEQGESVRFQLNRGQGASKLLPYGREGAFGRGGVTAGCEKREADASKTPPKTWCSIRE